MGDLILPDVLVKLDDGTGTYPTDISASVDLDSGIQFRRGRDDEDGTITASSLSMAFNNPAFTLSIGQWFRVTTTPAGQTPVIQFTGRILSVAKSWPDEDQPTRCVVAIEAADRQAQMALRTLEGTVSEEILRDDPYTYLPLNEGVDRWSLGDASGKGRGGLGVFNGDLPWGKNGPVTDGGVGLDFVSGTTPPVREYGNNKISLPTSACTIETFFLSAVTPGGFVPVLTFATSDGTAAVGLFIYPSTGQICFIDDASLVMLGTTAVTDGVLHHIALTISSGTGRFYIDGNASGSASITPPSRFKGLTLGAANGATTFTGSLARIALYDSVISTTRIADHAAAGGVVVSQESSDERIARLASYGVVPSLDLEVGALSPVASRDISGTTLDAALQDVALAEGGLVFMSGDDKLTFQNRYHRALQTTPVTTLSDAKLGVGFSTTLDTQKKFNRVTGTRPNGGVQVVQDDADIVVNDVISTDLDLLVTTDQEVIDRINWHLATHLEPTERGTGFAVDMAALTAAQQAVILGLEISDRVALSNLPAETDIGDQIIEGFTMTLNSSTWTFSFNTTPWALERRFVIGDAVYGVLDDPLNRLGY